MYFGLEDITKLQGMLHTFYTLSTAFYFQKNQKET